MTEEEQAIIDKHRCQCDLCSDSELYAIPNPRIAELEAGWTNTRRLLQISDERVTRLSGKADELEDGNHYLGEQNYILTGRIAELEAALKDALYAWELVHSKYEGIESAMKNHDEAEERIQKARAVSQDRKAGICRAALKVVVAEQDVFANTEQSVENLRLDFNREHVEHPNAPTADCHKITTTGADEPAEKTG